MIELADIQLTDRVLEPSAGQGAIVDSLEGMCASVDLCEFMSQNREILEEKGYDIFCNDFLDLSIGNKYNKIIANPPFSKDQDCKHVLKMYEHLVSGGTLVAVMSKSWMRENKNKVQQEFANLINKKGNTLTTIESGEFKQSGTSVATALVVIKKP
jgi:tRNA1(Val) A37 N6-methylase TrmN6